MLGLSEYNFWENLLCLKKIELIHIFEVEVMFDEMEREASAGRTLMGTIV